MQRAESLAFRLIQLVLEGCNAEVCHFDAAVGQQHNVLGLDVPVNNASLMGMLERVRNLPGKMKHLLPGDGMLPLHILAQRNAGEKLHDKIAQIFRLADVIDGYDARMGKLCNRMGLGEKLPADLLISEEFIPHDFDGDLPVQPGIQRTEDDGHAAFADFLQDLIPVIQHRAQIFGVGFLTHGLTTTAIVTLSPAPRA